MEDYRLEQSGQEVQDILNGAAMQVDLTAEKDRAELAERTLQGNIDDEASTRENADIELQGHIDDEETRAKAAEKQNADDIDAIEEKIPSGASSQNKLATAGELAAKQDALTFDNAPTPSSTNPVTSGGVYTAIDNEKGARINADAALQQSIEAILLLIPSAASALNQLADKSFVNSTVATASATFRGTYNLVSDLSLAVTATHAQIAAALAGAVSGTDNNDYCFVQIPTSADTPTEIRVTERYKFNGEIWAYEYDLNNSGFTAAQWEAINSAITSALVTKLSALPTASELATLFAGKQNMLTFDNAPVSGSDNPVKSGGIYDAIAAITAVIPSTATSSNKLVDLNALTAYVTGIIGALDASFDLTSTDGHVTLKMTQVDGVITTLQILTSDIASAQALATLGGQVSTNADDIAALQALYNALQQSAPQVIEPADTWPVASPSDTVIYRVIDRVNTPPQYYSDYMWNGTTMVLMATYNNAIDPRPKKASQNLVTSGGVFDNMGALDVSELNATENPHALAQYVDLSAALAAVPIDYQKGGMSIKFVQSYDNKYVQYRLMADNWSISIADWVGEICEEDILTTEVISLDNEYTDKYINSRGNLVSANGYAVTESIDVIVGDILYVTCIGRYACIVSEEICDTNNIPLVLNDENAVKTYIYQVTANRKVHFCYEYNKGIVVKRKRNKVLANKHNIAFGQYTDYSEDKLYAIGKAILEDDIEGKVINTSGDVGSHIDFNITYKITLRKGNILKLRTVAQSNITVLAKINEVDSALPYTPLLIGQSSTSTPYSYNDYTYEATADMECVVCHFGTSEVQVEIYKNVEDTDTERIFNKIVGESKKKSFTIETDESGKYIDLNGVYRSASGYIISKSIHLNKGDKIRSVFKSNVAAIAEVFYPKNAYKVIKSGSSYSTDAVFEYTATNDIDIVFCCYIGSGSNPTATITRSNVIDIIDGRFDEIGLKIYDTEICKIPQNIICIGDSVTEGITLDYSMIPPRVDNSLRSYPEYLKKINGTEVVINAGKGGYDAKEWWAAYQNAYDFTQYEVAIIEFGYNDGLNSEQSGTFATDIEHYIDYNDFADTRVGCYGKIVGKILDVNPRCFVILNISPLLDRYYPGSSDCVKQIAQKFGIPYNDLADKTFIDLNDPKYHGYPSQGATSKDDIHLTPAGYAAKALLINKFLAKNMIENNDLFDNMLYFGLDNV